MFLILFFTIIGFMVGLAYVMVKRRIRPGKLLAATFLALLATGLWKILKEHFEKNMKRGGDRWRY